VLFYTNQQTTDSALVLFNESLAACTGPAPLNIEGVQGCPLPNQKRLGHEAEHATTNVLNLVLESPVPVINFFF
jgi:hypothetical protein